MYHKMNMASRDHIIFTAFEMNLRCRLVLNFCPKHQHEKIRCIAMTKSTHVVGFFCVGTEHRKCEILDTIENDVHVLKESGQMDSLLNELNAF